MTEPSKIPCPECGERVEYRRVELETNYPGAIVWRSLQVKLGPEHERWCGHYKQSVEP
jgi:hypothetical protein